MIAEDPPEQIKISLNAVEHYVKNLNREKEFEDFIKSDDFNRHYEILYENRAILIKP